MTIDLKIEVTNYKKVYPSVTIHFSKIRIQDRVTLILGENGSGKSTLQKSIVGLVKYQGKIEIKGTISYMPEYPTFPKDTTVSSFLSSLNYLDRCDNEYESLVKRFELSPKIDSLIATLSKGMLGKLNLIQCLMRNADIYILDEPFNGLDKSSVDILINYINSSKKSFILSSHIVGVYDKLPKKVIQL